MNSRKSVNKYSVLKTLGQSVILPLVLSFLLVVLATLYPFNFSIQEDTFVHQLLGSLRKSSNLVDQVANIFLFIPFGISLSRFSSKKTRLSNAIIFVLVFITSLAFSTTIELLQTFLPSRASSLSDILTNTTGGACGYFIHQLGSKSLGQKFYWVFRSSFKKLTVKQLIAAFIGYLVFVFLITIGLHNVVNLSNWSADFPLLIGNERTGDRPWVGTIYEIAIADNAISEDVVANILKGDSAPTVLGSSLITEYRFKSDDAFLDTRKHSPNLIWKGAEQSSSSDNGVSLSPQGWLETSSSATFINQRLRETSEFTLSLIVATGNKNQSGPARIVSFSQNPYERNLTVGQEKQDLVVRLRTPLSGNNGTSPEIYVSNAFRDNAIHRFVITYADATLRVYRDQVQHLQTFGYTPELALLSYVIPSRFHVAKIVDFLHYILIFVPLAFLLALITNRINGTRFFYGLLALTGIFIPVLFVELLRVSKSHCSVSLENLLLSVCIFLVAFLIAKFLTRSLPWGSVKRFDGKSID